MRMYDIILKKRANLPLTDEEIRFVIDGYVKGEIPDYQVSALLMTIVFNGMNARELGTLTLAMAQSGNMVDLSNIDGITVDKHSTGGVGDKTTLIIAPLVAACGGKVAKMSGRGLGHTGGTIDKMESIPNLKVSLEKDAFINQVNQIGLAVIGQSEGLAPADKKLYALRDVTGTVDSIPLIASSVMSKKLASGAQAILLDVKVGSGAFMKNIEDARELAKAMVDIGKENGRSVKAILTDMDRPLGHAIGNALEIREVIDTLKGHGPEDLTHECIIMAAHMLVLSHKCDYETALSRVQEALDSGAALERLRMMIDAQDGDSRVIDDESLLAIGKFTYDVTAPQDGYIIHMNTEQCGIASVMLGAGRTVKDGPIDYSAGIVMHKKTGDAVSMSERIATLYASDESLFTNAAQTYLAAITTGNTAPKEKDIQKLIDRAIVARDKTYSPYSHFGVGAALLCEDGTIYEGCNIENASYGLTNCAERTAIFKAVSEGQTKFKALAVVADTEGPCAPCGACRQVISEFEIPRIIMANLRGDYTVVELEGLLPFRFGADNI